MFFKSLGGRRTGRVAEAVKIDAVGDASGCLEESVHEVLEGVLLGVCHFESCQLVLLGLLAVHSDQRQGDVSPTARRRFLPFLHSVCNLVQSSHQRLEVSRHLRLGPELGVHSDHRRLQPSQIVDCTIQARLQSKQVHRDFIFHGAIDGVETCLDPSSFSLEVLTEFCFSTMNNESTVLQIPVDDGYLTE